MKIRIIKSTISNNCSFTLVMRMMFKLIEQTKKWSRCKNRQPDTKWPLGLHTMEILIIVESTGRIFAFDILYILLSHYTLFLLNINLAKLLKCYAINFQVGILLLLFKSNQIKMNEQQIKNLLFVQELNNHRLKLRETLDQNQDIGSVQLTEQLMKMQLLMYQNKNTIELNQQLNGNTQNLLRLINWQHKFGVNSNQTDDQKFNINFQEELMGMADSDLPISRNLFPVETIMEQKPEKNQFYNKTLPKQVQIKNAPENKVEQQRKKPAEFVSANSLPKGTSIRKKFVPPFKKQKQQGFKMKDPNDKDSEDGMDPRYANLQAKLVQIIESEIVERDKKVEWSQIAGLGFAKKIIHEMIVWPMLRPDIFTGLRAPPKGILLFGPPGTGKTMIGRAIASEAQATFFSISASSITSKWVGQSEKLVKTLFSIARLKQPSVIFIDEIDSLLCSRKQGEQQSSRRVKTQFLVELDGAKTTGDERVLIIGATNLPQQLDDAVRRRFVKRLYIPLPNFQGRKQLILTLTDNICFDLKEEEVDRLSQLTKGFSGADMYSLCSQASFVPLRTMHSSIQTIRSSEVPVTNFTHFLEALKLVRPSVNSRLLQDYEDWNKMYGSYQLSPDELEYDQEQAHPK